MLPPAELAKKREEQAESFSQKDKQPNVKFEQSRPVQYELRFCEPWPLRKLVYVTISPRLFGNG